MTCSKCGRCGGCRACSDGCDTGTYPDGSMPVLFGLEAGFTISSSLEVCRGCGCRLGQSHHLACPFEACPKCQRSALLERRQ